jgi:L-alanine-DL-glutamate epimerase-like enolase superfamily enzyme
MKITAIETIRLAGPEFSERIYPAWAPGSVWMRQNSGLVRVETDEGIVGWGAAYPADFPRVNDVIAPMLIGKDPFLLEQHARIFRNAGGAWGTEIALWDIIGKALGQPLFRLWGAYRDRVPAYASCIELRTGEQRAEDALKARDAGWRAMKLRLHAWTMREDIAQAEGVRTALGDDFVILTDANQAQQPGTLQPEEGPVWTYERAVQTARELERLGVYWLEEPLDRYNFKDLRRLCDAVDLLIAGGENNRGLYEFRTLIEDDVYDVIQPEALVTETMSGLRKIAALAEMHHKKVAPHHGGGGVGIAAHLHLACAIPNSTYFELLHEPPGMSADDFQWYLNEPVHVDAEGNVHAPTGPGLGVEPDPDKLARYRVG